MKPANHFPGRYIKCREQRCGAVSDVIICSSVCVLEEQGQRRLSSIDSLYLTFLINTTQRLRWWFHIQANDIVNLGYKIGIGRLLERIGIMAMRLQTKNPPD